MKALITGASSGLGREFAYILSNMGYDLILVARRKGRLESIKKGLKTNVKIIPMDLASTFNCVKIHDMVKDENIDILINNAGFGMLGEFYMTKLEREMDMIDLNIKCVHTLTKLFINDMMKRNSGYILNVASSAAFSPGPLMATYYATKAYVYNLTMAISEELKKSKSNVYVGCLCPGPVDTEFNKVAKVEFSMPSKQASYVANYAIEKMLKRKKVIIPGNNIKMVHILQKLLPLKIMLPMVYEGQKGKVKE